MLSPHDAFVRHAASPTGPASAKPQSVEMLQRLLLDIECAMAACEDAGCTQWTDTLRSWAEKVAEMLREDRAVSECRSPEIWLG
jgi:hypothetical protein